HIHYPGPFRQSSAVEKIHQKPARGPELIAVTRGKMETFEPAHRWMAREQDPYAICPNLSC
ncbi:MAG: hypothetical protein V3W43_05345, partial [Desulfatiglandaceae bacterium]